jgi:carbon monoxide dehydrogenase subunit G
MAEAGRTVSGSVVVAAPAAQLWRAVTDWERQGEWVPLTRVSVRGTEGGAGAGLVARTGFGPVGFTDSMVVTLWDPPRECRVRHTGSVVRGTASFVVSPESLGAARFTWTERLDLPWGAVGRVGWPVARPLVQLGLRLALRRLSSWAPLHS